MEVSGDDVNNIPSTDSTSRKLKIRKSCVLGLPILKRTATVVLAAFFLFGTLWGLLGPDVLPGSQLFALLLLVFCCHAGGLLVSIISLPPLIGMLIAGFLFRNLPFIPYYEDISVKWGSAFRSAALVIILLRAGLGLDLTVLRQMSFVCLRLAFTPCMAEAVTAGLVVHFVSQVPWALSFALGFVLSAVSPAVVIPSMLMLQEKGYGQEKGITTLIVAASSIDDVFAIAGFGLALGIAFSTGDLVWTVLKGPLQVVIGLVYGGIVGMIFWYLPDPMEDQKVVYRVLLLTFGGLAVMFVSQVLDYAATGALGCLSLAFVAAMRWRIDKEKNVMVENVISALWQILQTFLFGLIGAEVSLNELQKNIGYDLLVLVIGLTFRLFVTYCVLYGSSLNLKEKIFVAVAWLPKATVQAAIGSVALDFARSKNMSSESILYGTQILSIAVLSIMVTAPLGAIAIAILGPVLLQKSEAPKELEERHGDGSDGDGPFCYGSCSEAHPAEVVVEDKV